MRRCDEIKAVGGEEQRAMGILRDLAGLLLALGLAAYLLLFLGGAA